MFPGVKTPGYSQDVPPGQRNGTLGFPAMEGTQSIRDAFKDLHVHGVQPGNCGPSSASDGREIRVRGNDGSTAAGCRLAKGRFSVFLIGFLGLCLSFNFLKARAGAEVGSGPQLTGAQLKAAWVFKFLKTTDWPQDATNKIAPYLLGILGKDPFGEELLEKFAQQKVNNRPIAVKRCSNVDEAKACHVVFISASEKDRLPEILNALQDSSVLTIGDTDEFARLGGIIGLTIGKEQAFEINQSALKRSKLNIDTKVQVCGKLLRLR
jgi:hypothetical protein